MALSVVRGAVLGVCRPPAAGFGTTGKEGLGFSRAGSGSHAYVSRPPHQSLWLERWCVTDGPARSWAPVWTQDGSAFRQWGRTEEQAGGQAVFPKWLQHLPDHRLFSRYDFTPPPQSSGVWVSFLEWSGLVTMARVIAHDPGRLVLNVTYLPPTSLGMLPLGSQPPQRSHI